MMFKEYIPANCTSWVEYYSSVKPCAYARLKRFIASMAIIATLVAAYVACIYVEASI